MEFGFTTAAYVVAAVLFILSLGGLSGQESAKRAVWYGIVGMALAVVATLIGPGVRPVAFVTGADRRRWRDRLLVAQRVQMTADAGAGCRHALAGRSGRGVRRLSTPTLNWATCWPWTTPPAKGWKALPHCSPRRPRSSINILRIELFLGVFIGAITFTGSVIAYGKLAGKVTSAAVKLPGGHTLNAAAAAISVLCLIWYIMAGGILPLIIMTIAALFIGYHLIMGIGGADMPVVVSMLNSYSGWAAAAIGFSLGNDLLIVVGALVGSSGAILSYIMCKAMNRSFISVILGGFGGTSGPAQEIEGEQIAIDAEGVAAALDDADSVIIVPGYGMAVAQAQQNVAELTRRCAPRARKCASPSTRWPAVCRAT
jgi:NAD(P) transhydrogenase subunit beta